MIIIKGKNTNAKIFTDNVESKALDQVRNMANNEISEKTQIRIMPEDCQKTLRTGKYALT